jgi:hypothetical protein
VGHAPGGAAQEEDTVEIEDPDDRKLVVLARSARARTRSLEGAAVRDRDGRTYAGATVALPALQVSALGVATAMAVSSGATGLEAAVVVGESPLSRGDLTVLGDFGGAGVPVWRCGPDGTPLEHEQT